MLEFCDFLPEKRWNFVIIKHQSIMALQLRRKIDEYLTSFNGKFYTFPYFLTFLLKRYMMWRIEGGE